jgi:hypothetical protein
MFLKMVFLRDAQKKYFGRSKRNIFWGRTPGGNRLDRLVGRMTN